MFSLSDTPFLRQRKSLEKASHYINLSIKNEDLL